MQSIDLKVSEGGIDGITLIEGLSLAHAPLLQFSSLKYTHTAVQQSYRVEHLTQIQSVMA